MGTEPFLSNSSREQEGKKRSIDPKTDTSKNGEKPEGCTDGWV